MTDCTFEGKSITELEAIAGQLQQAIALAQAQARAEQQTARTQLANSEGALDALIGPADITVPTIDNINGLVLYSDELLIQHAALVFRQILAGMKILAENQRTVARITRVNLETE